MNTSEEIIEKLDLQPHPEGGYFKEVYRSDGIITSESLSSVFEGDRNYATSIYFLLTSENFSAFHKINQDEIWHFYDGTAIQIFMISPKGEFSEITLGRELEKGQVPQYIVPKNYWFASKVISRDSFSLVGCTVAPGFDFRDFVLANREELINKFPKHRGVITKLTRI